WIPTLPVNGSLDDHLRRSFQQIREFLADISPDLIPALTADSTLQDLHALQEDSAVLSHLRGALSADVFKTVKLHVAPCGASERRLLLKSFAETVEMIREQFGSVEFITLELLLKRAQRQPPAQIGRTEAPVQHRA